MKKSLIGYDFISNKLVVASAKNRRIPEEALVEAKNLSQLAESLGLRVDEKMLHAGLFYNEPLTEAVCERLFWSGLEVEPIFLPAAQLRDVLIWRTNTDII